MGHENCSLEHTIGGGSGQPSSGFSSLPPSPQSLSPSHTQCLGMQRPIPLHLNSSSLHSFTSVSRQDERHVIIPIPSNPLMQELTIISVLPCLLLISSGATSVCLYFLPPKTCTSSKRSIRTQETSLTSLYKLLLICYPSFGEVLCRAFLILFYFLSTYLSIYFNPSIGDININT